MVKTDDARRIATWRGGGGLTTGLRVLPATGFFTGQGAIVDFGEGERNRQRNAMVIREDACPDVANQFEWRRSESSRISESALMGRSLAYVGVVRLLQRAVVRSNRAEGLRFRWQRESAAQIRTVPTLLIAHVLADKQLVLWPGKYRRRHHACVEVLAPDA